MFLLFFLILAIAKAQQKLQVTGIVIDQQGNQIAGVYIKLYQQKQVLQTVQTKDDGSYSVEQMINNLNNIEIEASLVNNLQQPQLITLAPVSKENIIQIKQDFKLTVDDVTIDGSALVAKILGSYITKTTNLALPDTKITYTIVFSKGYDNFQFPSLTNQQGQSKLTTIIPKSNGIVKLLAEKENYWNYRQTTDDDPNFILIVSKDYKVNYQVIMEEGQFTQTISGIVIDKISKKPLENVKVQTTFSSGTQGLLDKIEKTTLIDGKFIIEYKTKLWYQFIIHIEFLKDYYSRNEITKTISMDHDDKTKISNIIDFGNIELPVQPHVILTGLVINPYQKPQSNLELQGIAKCLDIKTDLKVTTDNQGKWSTSELLLEPQNKYDLILKYINKLKQEVTTQFQFQTSIEVKQTIQIQTINFQDLIDLEINGKTNQVENIGSIKIPLSLTCDQINNPSINTLGTCNFDGTFDLKWNELAQADKNIKCSLQQGNTQAIQPFQENLELLSPTWKYTKNLNIKYITFTQTINGIVKDFSQLLQFMPNIQVQFKLYQKEPINIQETTKKLISSSKDGTYQIQFPLYKGETIFIDITTSVPDFQDYNQVNAIKLIGDKDLSTNFDITLKRIEFNVILNYKVNTLELQSTIQIKSTKPLMQYSQLYDKIYTSNDGTYKMNFICYQNVEYTATLELNIKTFQSIIYQSNSFKCISPTKDNPEIQLTGPNLFIKVIFSARFYDGNNKLIPGIEASIKTDPISTTLNGKSQQDGQFSLEDTLIIKNQQYKATLTYKNQKNQQQSIDITFFPTEDNFKVQFPDQYLSSDITYVINGQIKLDRGTLVNPVKIVTVCGETTIENVSELNGNFVISFKKAASFNDIYSCKTTISGDVETKTFESQFGKGQYSITQTIQTKLIDVNLNIKGKFIDPSNKVKADLAINLIMTYETIQEKIPLVTNKDGIYEIKSKQIKANANYQMKINYKNGNSKDIELELKPYQSSVFTIKPIDTIDLQDQYYQDFQECRFYGQIQEPKNLLPVEIPIKYNCDSVQKDGKVIDNQFNIDFNSKFDQKFFGLVEFDKVLNCQLSSLNQDIVKLDQKIQLTSPKWEQQLNLQIQFTTWKIDLKGLCKDSQGIEKSLKDTEILINIHSKTTKRLELYLKKGFKQHYLTQQTQLKAISQADGTYDINFLILNKEILSIDIQATHQDFQQFTKHDVLITSGSKDENLNYEIQLERIEFASILSSTLEDESTEIFIKSSTPQMPNNKLYNVKTTFEAKKPFFVQFSCYQNIEYTANFIALNEHQQSVEYITEPFKCKKSPEVTLVVLKSLSNKFTLTVSGSITDKDKIISFVNNANIKIEILKNNKIVQTTQVTSNQQGKYESQIQLRPDTYILNIIINHPQFQEATIQKIITFQANSQELLNFELSRQILKQKITLKLTDINGKPLSSAQVIGTNFSPKQGEQIDGKNDPSGNVSIEVSCYKEINENFEIQVKIGELTQTQKQSTKCDGQNSNLNLVLNVVYITISGQVIDPYGKGKQDLNLQLSTIPVTQQLKLITNLNGQLNGDLIMALNEKYNILVTYQNFENKEIKETQEIQIQQSITQIQYHIIYYEQNIDAQIKGTVDTNKYHLNCKNLKFNLQCNQIKQEFETDDFSEYSIKFQYLAKFDQKLPCSITRNADNFYEAKQQDFSITPPQFIIKQDIILYETQNKIQEIKTGFKKYLLVGVVVSQYNCDDKDLRIVEDATIKLTHGDTIKAITRSDESGNFKKYFLVSKHQSSNFFYMLTIEKDGFSKTIGPINLPPDNPLIDDDTIQTVGNTYYQITPIKDIGCPKNAKKVINNNQNNQDSSYIHKKLQKGQRL